VTARLALINSLNAPAVRILRMAGIENVLQTMRRSGLQSLIYPSGHYGDSLILGGCDVRAIELLEAYSALASGGNYRPLIYRKGTSDVSRSICSPEAAWLVTQILTDTQRLDYLSQEIIHQDGAQIAFKTGTSYGLRDAWTVGWTQEYTIVLWIGDPMAAPYPGLVGLTLATPPVLKLFRLIGTKHLKLPQPPSGLVMEDVCALSGRTPTDACPQRRLDWVIRGVTRKTPCPIHELTGGKQITLLPPEFQNWVPKDAALLWRNAPSPEIVSPISGGKYFMTPGAIAQKLPFRVEGTPGHVWWYLDGVYIGTEETSVPFFYGTSPGWHTLTALDEMGRTASTKFEVFLLGSAENETVLPLNGNSMAEK
jgi:penicillin-binding protein 1C